MRQQKLEMLEILMVSQSIILMVWIMLKKGVAVIMKDGKIQFMMPSDYKSFNKMQCWK